VDLQEPRADAEAFLKTSGVTLPLMADAQGAVAGQYGVSGIPTAVVIDKNGAIVKTMVGGTTAAELDAVVAGLH
jgi:cytochrome c biogenesis protein CcmG/thiol:disulfide interchange protein DsbE